MEHRDESSVATDPRRDEMLLKMYDQMFNDINRHILVVWQSVGVLIGALAVFALAEKKIISVDVAATLIVLLTGWLVAHLSDASYWYNRNLVIIANIERQFLNRDDLRWIHYYFGAHRPRNKMISHLRIQLWLAIGLGLLVMIVHFWTRVAPGFSIPNSDSRFDPQRALPYAFLLLTVVVTVVLHKEDDLAYEEFLTNSPGIPVDTSGIKYGIGHGFGSTLKVVLKSWFGGNQDSSVDDRSG